MPYKARAMRRKRDICLFEKHIIYDFTSSLNVVKSASSKHEKASIFYSDYLLENKLILRIQTSP